MAPRAWILNADQISCTRENSCEFWRHSVDLVEVGRVAELLARQHRAFEAIVKAVSRSCGRARLIA
jgi:hypothetical protein